ncbi:MAG TPA: RDD family protein [Solirubrobacterales bacterium]|nr:RDD family protein [Solirubrobacterales bacterium]
MAASDSSDSNGRARPEVPIGGRLLEGGARGVGRLAGATGIDRTVEVAVEEAIVRALESAAVERAVARLIEDGRLATAIEDSIDEERLEATIRRAIDSEVADRVWEEILAGEKAQMLVERIAEAPEVRAAIASQGAGLISDLGRQLQRTAAAVDDFLDRIARRLLRRPPRSGATDHVGLAGRGIALLADFGILAAGFALFTALLSGVLQLLTDENLPPLVAGLLSFGGLVIGATYLVGFWAFEGQTPGMRFLSIRLEHEGSPEIGVGRAFRRLVGSVLAVLPFCLGLVPILLNERRRGLQDRIADTDVVRRDNRVLAPWSENRVPGRPG